MIGAASSATIGMTIEPDKLLQGDRQELAKLILAGLQLLFGWIANRRKKPEGPAPAERGSHGPIQ